MSCRDRLEAYLRENGVSYEVLEHAQAFTAQEVAASEHVPGRMLAKVVMALADRALRMLVLSSSDSVDFARARAALGAEGVRLASESAFAAAFPDCDVGAMPPFGNLYGIPVFVDRALADQERIVFQAGTHTTSMAIRYADFARLVRPAVVDLAEPVRELRWEDTEPIQA